MTQFVIEVDGHRVWKYDTWHEAERAREVAHGAFPKRVIKLLALDEVYMPYQATESHLTERTWRP